MSERLSSNLPNLSRSCLVGCGACCIAPSISSPIPGMPSGKPAGVRCAQLDDENRCTIFGDPRRPAVCTSLQATVEMCGNGPTLERTRAYAMTFLTTLERATKVNNVS